MFPFAGASINTIARFQKQTFLQTFPICVNYILPFLFEHGQQMSNRLCQTGGMKLTNSSWFSLATVETMARFGTASLVRNLDGRHELIGGTPSEHSAAREWCSLFAPEIVFTSTPQAASPARSVALAARPRRVKFLRAVRRKIEHHGFYDYAKTGDQIRNRGQSPPRCRR